MGKAFLYVMLIVLAFCACEFSDRDKVLAKVDNEFTKSLKTIGNRLPAASSVYMVIPRAGCSGCISSAELFMQECLKDSLKRNDAYFILTNFDSEKLLRVRFGDLLRENSDRLLIDRNDVFVTNLSLKSIYPVVYIYGKNGRLENVSEVSPTEDGLNEVQNFFVRQKKN